MNLIKDVTSWMYRNARPLELARWQYHFEDGNREEVLKTLSFYQNKDGGFGHGLEADCLNPDSSPMQTWAATEILWELGKLPNDCAIVTGILTYLESCPYFIDDKWIGTIPSNNQYPHAEWWTYSEEMVRSWNWNPSVCLAGFILLHTQEDRDLYKKASLVAKKACDWFLAQKEMESMHETFCFMRFLEYCKKANITTLVQLDQLEAQLRRQIAGLIEKDVSRWQTEYVCKPSFFIHTIHSIFYAEHKELIDIELEFIKNTVTSEGIWTPSWCWGQYPNEWAVSKNWWQGSIAIQNLLLLKGR